MGAPRASTDRRRLNGKVCCSCGTILPEPHTRGERYCDGCSAQLPHRRVYMTFMLRRQWDCQFLEEDLKTPLPRKVSFSDIKRMTDFAERGGCTMDLEARQAIEHGVEIGRGGLWLSLTHNQYASLKQESQPYVSRKINPVVRTL